MYGDRETTSPWDDRTSRGTSASPGQPQYAVQPHAGPSSEPPGPASPAFPFPSSLTPGFRMGAPLGSPRNDYFFTGSTARQSFSNSRPLQHTRSVQPQQSQPFIVPRSYSTPPEHTHQPTPGMAPSTQERGSLTEEEEFARIIALSERESGLEKDIQTQEEDELARVIAQSIREEEELSQAMAASMISSSPARSSCSNAEAGSSARSYEASSSMSVLTTPTASGSGSHWQNRADTSEDEALARQLAEQDEAEYGKAADGLHSLPFVAEEDDGELPVYEEVAATTPLSAVPMPVPTIGGRPVSVDTGVLLSRKSSSASSRSASNLSPRNSISSHSSRSSVYDTPSGERSGASPLFGSLSGPTRPASMDPSALLPSTSHQMSPRPASSYLPTLGEDDDESYRSTSAASAVVLNQFVESDLLRGVSLGFTAPVISADVKPLEGPMPNIISLPYGRCPPLHLQTPSWKRLLKLMASMGGTRVEPTIEAMALPGDIKLRVVVQFIKVHHTSTDWRTIIWLSLDHPVLPGAPQAFRYNGSDPTILPWSYSLTSVPALLRDGPDAAMSKAYTIPSTPNLPFPSLPISFPDLAMYMHAARSDSAQGKLGRIIKNCYPDDETIEDFDTERRSMSSKFKKVLGREKKKTGGKNDQTYDLVTPFVMSSEWG